jgi:biotin carboxyl carrier protein
MRRAVLLLLAVPPLWLASLALSTPAPRPARLAAPASTQATPTIDAVGRVYLDPGRVAHVRSSGPGRVVEVYAKPGDHVSAGAPLAVVEESSYAAGPYDVPRWVAYCRTETALYGAAEKEVAFAHCMPAPIAHHRHVVTAPADGTVIASSVALGAQVGGGTEGPALFEVGDEPRWMAEAEVGEDDVASVLPGAPVRVHVAARPRATLTGEVVRVSPVDPTTHVAKVICTMASAGLAGEVYASLQIPAGARAAAL